MGKTTILIVEDEAIVAADLSGKLGQLGYEVVGITAKGEEAIELACSRKPQVVLMDIRLKGPMDGIEAARQSAIGTARRLYTLRPIPTLPPWNGQNFPGHSATSSSPSRKESCQQP